MKIGRASARVLAPPPSMFYPMGLLTLCDLGSYPDLFSEWWLQILCYCADLYCWDIDKSMFSSCVLSSFYIFRVIWYGLWIRDLSEGCDFGVSRLVASITMACDCTDLVAAREDERISARVYFFLFLLLGRPPCVWGALTFFTILKPNTFILFEIGLCTYLGFAK